MNQEACETEDFIPEKNKRKGDIHMLRKVKRILSLVLALIMICSTMGVMAFAAEPNSESRVDNYHRVEKFFARDYTRFGIN